MCPGFFLELNHLYFLDFGMVLGLDMKFTMTEPDILEKLLFAPRIGKMGQIAPKKGFLNIMKNLVIYFY